MMLHLMKLSVGTRDLADMREWQSERLRNSPPLRHLTRHLPRRAAEILEGGSIYWVIAGILSVRQRVVAIEPSVRQDGSACAALVLDPRLVTTRGRPVKAFQGWRYLKADEAPPDLDATSDEAALPEDMAQRLRELCLL